MSQTQALINELKAQLKAHRKTYEDIAAHLQLSHASIKRLFSEGNISLPRLESICDMLNITLVDLMLSLNIENKKIDNLSLLQEQVIADDLPLLLFTVCIINGFTLEEILQEYALTEHECIRKLAKLDKLEIFGSDTWHMTSGVLHSARVWELLELRYMLHLKYRPGEGTMQYNECTSARIKSWFRTFRLAFFHVCIMKEVFKWLGENPGRRQRRAFIDRCAQGTVGIAVGGHVRHADQEASSVGLCTGIERS